MKKSLFALSLLASFSLFSCSDDDDNSPSQKALTLNINGLDNLGSAYAYEGWLIINGSPVSTGTFTVADNGSLSQTSFQVASDHLDVATKFVLSIEPVPDNDPQPAATKLLVGNFSGNNATLGVGTVADFSTSAGQYILATPSTTSTEDELSGVWFLNPNSGSHIAGLTLPTLASGWAYEGWVVVNNTPISTGTFISVSGNDSGNPFSGNQGVPAFPGEDFINDAPNGVTFPLDLSGKTVVISVEPVPDNSAAPFTLKPLAGSVPTNASTGTLYSLNNNVTNSFPTGTVSKE